ncbi:Calcium/calmodulin-dependent 3',5'-cyclic nucleotide phosphodiesterase 1B [Chelonia mydas]|uniref:Calcium/calmodulin-dependent 3',5'-cyclic nucleotide phosphodiesterase 1B n=1 Tax=Chelonia mydas TaxID=8469 RepID=M7AR23_CHEMY|nr:Calcium/calmodulin-dependent 3',5'-cyclic nucleotide phosphodiesterase 1B [Chelonia mydas]
MRGEGWSVGGGACEILDTEDELQEIKSDAVPSEVRDWLASTFTQQTRAKGRRSEEKPKFRSIVHAVQAGIFVERMFRRTYTAVGPNYSTSVINCLKSSRLPALGGLSPAPNLSHGSSGPRSDCAILYNDRSVLENHHISAVFRMMQEDEMNIFINLAKDEFVELRSLVIEMVLATDMSCHFQQVKSMKTSLQQLERIDKSKALSLLLHAADISHPTKQWSVHSRWTKALMEEFFRQGDKEAELGLPFSPLCDRKSTLVAQSQIGFIDFIVEPTFSVLTDVAEKFVLPLVEEGSKSKSSSSQQSSSQWRQPSLDEHSELGDINADITSFRSTWTKYIQENKQKWKERAASGITNQTSIDELSPCEEEPHAPENQHNQNGDME